MHPIIFEILFKAIILILVLLLIFNILAHCGIAWIKEKTKIMYDVIRGWVNNK